MTERKRFDYIDALRGWAILGVIVTHVGLRTLEGDGITGLIRKATDLGAMGVPLFYMVSAFTILYLYEKRILDESRPAGSFYIRRILRIAPVYWGGIILYTALYGLTGSRGWLEGPELWHYPLHLSFLNMTNPFSPSTVVPGGWSISNEVIFYLIFPAIFHLVRSLRGAIALFAACLMISPITHQLADVLVAHWFPAATPTEAQQFAYRWLPNQIVCFAAGFVMLHLLRDGARSAPVKLISGNGKLAVMALVISLPVVVLLSAKTSIDKNVYWTCWFLILGLYLSTHNPAALVNKLTVWLGKISFSCYIIHFIVIDLLMHVVPEFNAISRFLLVLFATLPITTLLAHLSFQYFEQPFSNIAKRLVNYYQKREKGSDVVARS